MNSLFQNYRFMHTNLGWCVGLIALVVYSLTLEPTASYWDCAEFIAASYKLEVPHPPGAPFFLLLGRMFSLFAPSVQTVAIAVNMLSAICAALTIVFLFWTIALLVGYCEKKKENEKGISPTQWIALGAGAAGALMFTFTDSFWFSAVEAEVYALSSLFTAIIVWSILRWERVAHTQEGWRWLLLIAYLLGLSIGVHLLGLATFPALALLYYYKKTPTPTTWGVIASLAIGVVLVWVVMFGIIQGLPAIAIEFDIFFVNKLLLPFGSGIIAFLAILISALVYVLYRAHKAQNKAWLTMLLSLCFILIGYSSYTLVLVRSGANPPIDENNPENTLTFLSYLRREQYGDRPLWYGPHYESDLLDQEKKHRIYRKGKKKYEVADWKIKPVYAPTEMMPFPRIYSQRDDHQRIYREVIGLSKGQQPNFFHNIYFLIEYQINHMYIRYLLWNYAGRESDEQHAGWYAPWNMGKKVPRNVAQNKARNQYFFLPLLLCILGMAYHFRKDYKHFFFVLALFLLMGVGLVLYLNMPPSEPRERDYIYLGSYYAFAIWGGMGLAYVISLFKRGLSMRLSLAMGGTMVAGVITWMAVENWDDHDRSGRYFSIDSAKNMLESCQKNAILFTGGDNDTFPLWYAQEVEGVRTDVRVVVLSYFNTDWYIEQMTRHSYDSKPLPFNLPLPLYVQGGPNDVLYRTNKDRVLSLSAYLALLKKEDPRLLLSSSAGNPANTIPGDAFVIRYDTAKTKYVVPEELRDSLVPRVVFALNNRYLEKKDLAILDLISAKQWDRPLYFNFTSLRQLNFDIENYIVQEGLVFRYLPVRRPRPRLSLYENEYLVDAKRMYHNVMEKYAWRGTKDARVYLSEDYRDFMYNHRSVLTDLCYALLDSNDLEGIEKAHEVLRLSMENLPGHILPHNYISLPMVDVAFRLKDVARAKEVGSDIVSASMDRISALLEQGNHHDIENIKRYISTINYLMDLYEKEGLSEEVATIVSNLQYLLRENNLN